MIDWSRATFAVLIAATLWLLVSASGCASHKDPGVALAANNAIIEGHLATVPTERLGGRRLVIYLGDPVIPESAPGEEPRPATSLTNIRKAVSAEEAERRYLADLYRLLAGEPEKNRPGWKLGAEGPVLRLFGEHPEGRHAEMVLGADFVFCFAQYTDPVTGRPDLIDVCYGGRLRDKAVSTISEKALGLGGKAGKLINPLD